MIAAGDSLKHALALAVEVEALCEQYWRALQIGKPAILSDAEMKVVLEKFKTYGETTRNQREPRRTRRKGKGGKRTFEI